MATNTKTNYQLHLKGFVGGYDFDADYVDFILGKNKENEVNVLIDSLGGQSSTALSIFSAFKRHGNVNVHFVGMNASAATIASLGAKHITMDTSAMYLVHKCSVGFFEWGQLNSDGLQALIDNIEHQKADLDKLDANIAQMYATRCKKESAELLDLMKQGGWLTAQEALQWGFVDELTDYEDESAPVLTDTLASAMSSADLPEIVKWTFFDTAHTKITHEEYDDEEGDLLVVKTGDDMGMIALMLNNQKTNRIEFVCTYPFHKGLPHKLKIKKVAEWKSQVEAVVYAELDTMPIAFYATDYYANKAKYVPGAELDIELAASGYHVVEGEEKIVLDAETSARMRKDMGIEPECDEDGNVLPMELYNNQLVAYLRPKDEFPDDAEFASPVESVEECSLFGIEFIKAVISISHDSEETYVPLYFKKEFLPNVKKGSLLRGFLWMQGKISII